MFPLIVIALGLGGLFVAHAAAGKKAPPSTAPKAPPPVDAHLPPVTQALVQKAATTGTNPANLVAAAQQLYPNAPLAAQALADRAKAVSPQVAAAAAAAKPQLAGYHLNEPGFYSDQTNINPIWYRRMG